MRSICIALAAITLATPAAARSPSLVVATNPERATPFVDRADCEKSLGVDPAGRRGSMFNRAAGNISRCELIDGEFQIVVYPNPGRRAIAD